MTDFKKERKKRGWTQLDLALVLDVSVRTVQDWEQGRRIPDRRSKKSIEKWLRRKIKKEN